MELLYVSGVAEILAIVQLQFSQYLYYIVDVMHIIIHKFLDVHLPFRLSSTK